jgi:transcriptional regulator with PAS, ATPase and Fis domain
MPGESTHADLFELFGSQGFVTTCRPMAPVLRSALKAAAASDITVLLEGETGTGKQVLARAIHNLDHKRNAFSFVTVHCSTIGQELAESELFGHRRGAFSGATYEREGLFQAANQGTLFLDDVNDLSLALQPKLLDVLQRGVVRGVGWDREVPVNVRVIAAANTPLEQLVKQGRFRADLYYRLNVVRLAIPPLRERPNDFAALILVFARRHHSIYPGIEAIDPALVEHLKTSRLSGNVRELEHAVQRMLFGKTEGTTLDVSDWLRQSGVADAAAEKEDVMGEAARHLWTAICEHGLPFQEAIRRLEQRVLEKAVSQRGQTRREIAGRLRTSERTLYHKLRSHNLTGAGVP